MAGVETKVGDPQGPDMRPFSEITPEDIGRALNVHVVGDPDVDDPDWAIIDTTGAARIRFNDSYHYDDGETHHTLEIYSQTKNNYEEELDHAEAILIPGSLTIVMPLEKGNEISSRRQYITWVTMSDEGTTLYQRERTIGNPWSAEVTPDILKAAGRGAARVARAAKVAQPSR